ncbi:hypothetical protein [Burkholderia plantarii]|uniref:hypothetical protein n=1 Tax=Burkholderia plantarii TaxID=41899 RepID=UPI0018DB0BC3|nr:hypothetical protein [Burkholderia plantarii]MBI0326084.1 hypothetical protein [Burkholderia plantarii]
MQSAGSAASQPVASGPAGGRANQGLVVLAPEHWRSRIRSRLLRDRRLDAETDEQPAARTPHRRQRTARAQRALTPPSAPPDFQGSRARVT